MPGHRIKKYSRRTRSQYKKSKAPVILAIIAFLLLSSIISVAIGISLSRREQESGEPRKRFELGREDYISGEKLVSAVDAYELPKGANVSEHITGDISELSVCIRHMDGSLDFRSEAAELYSGDIQGERELSLLCKEAHSSGGKVCAYIYITSFNVEDEYRRGIVKAYELALVAETFECGVDDILLLGISVTDENLDEIEAFVSEASYAAGKAPLGVAVKESILDMTSKDGYLAPRLREVCDYLALDLTHLTLSDGDDGNNASKRLEETIEKYEYYIKSYPMRLLFSTEASGLHAQARSMGAVDMQTVGK